LCLLCLPLALAACGTLQSSQWQALGENSEHTVLSLALDPAGQHLLYAGATGGIVYRARGDLSGQPAPSSGIPGSVVVGAVAPDPNTAGTVYAGTSGGFYVSTDYGETWGVRGSGFPADDTMAALVVATPGDAFFAGSVAHGVYASHDAGRTWQPENSGLPPGGNIDTLFWEPGHQILYASVDGKGLFATTDGGQTWTSRGAGLPARTFALASLGRAGLTGSGLTLYAGTEQGLYASTDEGAHWNATGRGLPAGRVLALATDPLHADWLYAGTDTTVYRSQDAGRSWSLLAPGLNHPVAAILAVAASATRTIVYAGAGQLQRYPPDSGSISGVLSTALTVLLLAALVAVSLYTYRRRRQQLMAIDRHLRASLYSRAPAQGAPSRQQPGAAPRGVTEPVGHNGDRTPRPPAPPARPAPAQPGTDGESADDGAGRA
jgi:photosystem II stability/assembly factor-like uncharacterized protein